MLKSAHLVGLGLRSLAEVEQGHQRLHWVDAEHQEHDGQHEDRHEQRQGGGEDSGEHYPAQAGHAEASLFAAPVI